MTRGAFSLAALLLTSGGNCRASEWFESSWYGQMHQRDVDRAGRKRVRIETLIPAVDDPGDLCADVTRAAGPDDEDPLRGGLPSGNSTQTRSAAEQAAKAGTQRSSLGAQKKPFADDTELGDYGAGEPQAPTADVPAEAVEQTSAPAAAAPQVTDDFLQAPDG